MSFFKRRVSIMGQEGLFTAGCSMNEDGTTMTCQPKFDTGKHIYKGERPMKLKIDEDVVILDDGGTPEPLVEKTIEMIERMKVR